MDNLQFFSYLIILAGSTYLIRAIPFAAVRKRIENRFIRSFLAYVPCACLTAMTFPAILTSAGHLASGIVSAAVCLALAYFGRSLLTVAAGGAAAALITECVIIYLIPLM